jgi:hypothetical protein
MAVKTKSELLTQINTLLADNASGDISAGDVRTVHTDAVDSLAANLGDLQDVTITSPSTGQALTYNGSVWVNGLSTPYPVVDTFAELPAAADNNGEVYDVRTTTGVIFVNRKEAGRYLSNGTTWNRISDNAKFVRTTATSGDDNRLLRSDGTTGNGAQESAVTVDDSGNVSTSGSVTSPDIITTDVQASGSAGVIIKNSGGTAVVTAGAGVGTGVTLAGGTNVGGQLDVTGNILVSGTVDGRDVATDGTKLDGIATGAEVNTIESVTAGEPTGSDQVLNVVSLTQAEYDAGTPVSTTFYIITDA